MPAFLQDNSKRRLLRDRPVIRPREQVLDSRQHQASNVLDRLQRQSLSRRSRL